MSLPPHWRPSRPRSRSLRWEWLLLTAALLAAVFWLSTPGQLARPNAWWMDLAARLQTQPASAEVVLVVADEASVATIGRWPWRRALHAQLIRHISQQSPQSIGLDILFTEEDWDYPEDDLLLAHAIADSRRVLLPVTQGAGGQPSLPLPLFAQAAAGLAHVQLPLDADGGVRSFYAWEGQAGQPWLHLGLAMQCVEHPERALCQRPAPASPTDEVWQRRQHTYIAYADGQPPFTTYSYVDVLRGAIPASAFRNKHVLIGATATGIASPLSTPGAEGRPQAHNVELVAHILNGSLQHSHMLAASTWSNRLFNLLPVALGLMALAVLGPSAALLSCVLLALATLLVAGLGSAWGHISWTPAAAILGLALAYPLWSWRRLNAAARFLNQEMQDLRSQGLGVLQTAGSNRGDFLQHRIQAVEQASHQLRQLHHFVTETLLQLPSPTLACDAQGRLLLANSAAHGYARSLGLELDSGQPCGPLLQGAVERDSRLPLWSPQLLAQREPFRREGIDSQQRSLLLIGQPFQVSQEPGWLLTLVDISDLRQALAQRDQAMHFISHDIRAPIGAILTLIEMDQHLPAADRQAAAAPSELLAHIQRYARSSLALADDFVHLVRAQQQTPKRAPVELGLVIDQALDDIWAAAAQRRVELAWEPQEAEAWVFGDASQLRRACVNLLSNAIKYGPEHSTVTCRLLEQPDSWTIEVHDQGAGIPAEEQTRLFQPFARQQQHEQSRIQGVGLGLAYVQTVALQHRGRVQLHSAPGAGTRFGLEIPKAPAPD